jgi:RimJ/RimL family protein N-acetyltransferase
MSELQLPEGGITDGVVSLRHWGPGDVAAIVDAMRDREISRWIPNIPFPYSERDARDFLRMDAEARRSGTGTHLAVADTASALIGGASLTDIERSERSAFAGYWVAAPLRRHGIATRVLRLVSKWGFEDLGLGTIYLTTDPLNMASQRVAERVGYSRVGTMERASPTEGGRYEDVVYRLARDEFARR